MRAAITRVSLTTTSVPGRELLDEIGEPAVAHRTRRTLVDQEP